MRKSNIFLLFLTVCASLFSLIFIHASLTVDSRHAVIGNKAEMVDRLQLTDLCLFTEASYTRHLSQADWNTPFQDHPASLEHFPSGSLVLPPLMKKSRDHEAMD